MSTSLLKRLAPRHIAVFRALQLGDMLCSVPALRALRATCPQARITLVGLPWAHAFAARFPHYVDDFLPFPGFPGLPERAPDLQAIPGFIAEAQACRFDLALQLHGDGRLSNAVVGLFGAARCAGFSESGEADAFLPYPDRGSEIERLLALTTHLGAPSPYTRLEFPLRDEDHAELASSGLADGIEAGGYLCLHAGARDVARRWPAECFAALGDWLHEATGLPLVLTGSADEQPLTARVCAGMKAPAIDAAAAISAGALAALLRGARLLVCNDTGVSHIAAALRVPSVVIYRTSDMARWAPADRSLHRAVWAPHTGAPPGNGLRDVIEQAGALLRLSIPAATNRAPA